MKVLIIEDEPVASKRLVKLVGQVAPNALVLGALESIKEALFFLQDHTPDLIFMDIHLSDGLCFEILEQHQDFPVIFTTAYDQYVLKAFKVNSIDYLLKPVDPEELQKALLKYHQLRKPYQISDALQALGISNYKSRFVVKRGRGYESIPTEQVAYFLAENKLNYLVDHEGKKYLTEYTLERLIDMVDPQGFYRINRNVILSFQTIKKITPYFNNRLLLEIENPLKREMVVSRNYLKGFRKWAGW